MRSIWNLDVSVGTDKHTQGWWILSFLKAMEGEEGSRKAGNLSDNPLLVHLVIIKMEEIMDKLKLLDYEAGFCKKLKFKPFPRQVLVPYTSSPQINYFITSTGTTLLFLLTLGSNSMHSPI